MTDNKFEKVIVAAHGRETKREAESLIPVTFNRHAKCSTATNLFKGCAVKKNSRVLDYLEGGEAAHRLPWALRYLGSYRKLKPKRPVLGTDSTRFSNFVAADRPH